MKKYKLLKNVITLVGFEVEKGAVVLIEDLGQFPQPELWFEELPESQEMEVKKCPGPGKCAAAQCQVTFKCAVECEHCDPRQTVEKESQEEVRGDYSVCRHGEDCKDCLHKMWDNGSGKPRKEEHIHAWPKKVNGWGDCSCGKPQEKEECKHETFRSIFDCSTCGTRFPKPQPKLKPSDGIDERARELATEFGVRWGEDIPGSYFRTALYEFLDKHSDLFNKQRMGWNANRKCYACGGELTDDNPPAIVYENGALCSGCSVGPH